MPEEHRRNQHGEHLSGARDDGEDHWPEVPFSRLEARIQHFKKRSRRVRTSKLGVSLPKKSQRHLVSWDLGVNINAKQLLGPMSTRCGSSLAAQALHSEGDHILRRGGGQREHQHVQDHLWAVPDEGHAIDPESLSSPMAYKKSVIYIYRLAGSIL